MDSLKNFIKIFLYFLVNLLVSSCNKSELSLKEEDNKTYINENRQFLKDMILCKCITTTDTAYYKNESSIGFFFNRCSYGPEIFEKIDSIIIKHKPKFESVVNNKLRIAECLKLYQNDSLKVAIMKLDKFIASPN
ncbi:MAG: hypothetical protein H7329_18195 [Opitutaceae bacterium]|nr:hypothetical protein [Cytophagales bacterium]